MCDGSALSGDKKLFVYHQAEIVTKNTIKQRVKKIGCWNHASLDCCLMWIMQCGAYGKQLGISFTLPRYSNVHLGIDIKLPRY